MNDMDRYEIESKYYIYPTKKRLLFKVLLNMVVVVMAFCALFFTLMDGFSINIIGELCVAILIVTYYNKGAKPYYQFSILNLEIESDRVSFIYNAVKLGSYTGTVLYEVSADNIDKIEYGKQLDAIRFTGNISKQVKGKSETVNELVVYCKKDAEKVIRSLEEKLNRKVDCME